MTGRTSSEITIKRRDNNTVVPVLTVPITRECRRRFYLMSEDYISLRFNLLSPVEFRIGDYIEDELFGRYVITEKQFPTFNEAHGCYDYTLIFNAYYMAWENRLFMLTTTASGTRIRKEASWVLTDILEKHVAEVVNNLDVLGFRYGNTGFTYVIENTATHSGEAVSISYDGTGIISALNTIAQSFKTEWWVSGNVIHFGKCESGSAMDFSLDTNMYAVTPQRNQNTYANRVYFFGGTQNIPDTYGKKLVFGVTETATKDGHTLFKDGTRPMTPDMLVRGDMEVKGELGAFSQHISSPSDFPASVVLGRVGDYDITLPQNTLSFVVRWSDTGGSNLPATLTGTYTLRYIIVVSSSEHVLWEHTGNISDTSETQSDTRTTAIQARIPALDASHFLINDTYPFSLQIVLSSDMGGTVSMLVQEGTLAEAARFSFICRKTSADCPLTFNGHEYTVRFNPFYLGPEQTDFTQFTFMNGDSYGTPPTGFGIGSPYTLGMSDGESDGVDITKVPLSFWSTDYSDPSSLMKIGENRLRLPSSSYPGGYMESDSAEDNDDTVEKAVILDHIYPKCTLKVTGITETQRKDTVDNSDGTSTYWNWIQYTLTASQKNGNPFPFKKNYIKSGVTLQARFLTPEDAEMTSSDASFRLAGMTFDVLLGEDSEGNPTYTLKRNETYGAKLPNDVLSPAIGDPFVLIGWDVNALTSLGLLDSAEEELASVASDYMDALEEDQFIFRCSMFSNSMFSLNSLPTQGQKVTVHFATVEKTSRILGYTFKLDMPWDSPEYEVGETDAYSRLRLLEEQMAEGGASGGTVTAESDSSGAQGMQPADIDLDAYLTADEIAAIYVTQDDADATYATIASLASYALASDLSSLASTVTTIGGNLSALAVRVTELEDLFEVVNVAESGQTPVYAIRPKHGRPFFSDSWISAFGISSSGGGGGGDTTLAGVWDSLKGPTQSYTDAYSNEKINIAHIPAFTVSTTGTGNVVAGMSYSNGVFTLTKTAVSSNWANIEDKPSSLAGYGIEDAYIADGAVHLGMMSITPLTAHQTLYTLTVRDASSQTILSYSPNDSPAALNLTASTVGLGNVQNINITSWATITGQTAKTITLGSSSVTIPAWALDKNTLLGELATEYHPLHGSHTLSFDASTISCSSVLTVGNNDVTNAKIFFGSSSHFIELRNVGTTQNPSYAFRFSDALYSEGFVSAFGISPDGGGGGGGCSCPEHVLISEEDFAQMTTFDDGKIYLVYEEEEEATP